MEKVTDYSQLEWVFELVPEVEALYNHLQRKGFKQTDYESYGKGILKFYDYFFKSEETIALISITVPTNQEDVWYSFSVGGLVVVTMGEVAWKRKGNLKSR